MNVTYLPVYYPSEEEQADPKLYAHNVRQAMVRKTTHIQGNSSHCLSSAWSSHVRNPRHRRFSSSLLCPARAQADELATSGIQATEHSYEDVILLHHALRRRYPHDKVCL
jgi:hypothetical protein